MSLITFQHSTVDMQISNCCAMTRAMQRLIKPVNVSTRKIKISQAHFTLVYAMPILDMQAYSIAYAVTARVGIEVCVLTCVAHNRCASTIQQPNQPTNRPTNWPLGRFEDRHGQNSSKCMATLRLGLGLQKSCRLQMAFPILFLFTSSHRRLMRYTRLASRYIQTTGLAS